MSKDKKPTRRDATPPAKSNDQQMAQPRVSRRPAGVPAPPADLPTMVNPSGRRRPSALPPMPPAVHHAILFDTKNYMYFAFGILMIVVGFFLMSGGGMDNPNEWDESKIYSSQRITLAPIVVLSGIGVVIYGIFFRAPEQPEPQE
jgi:hypothetical protein